MVVQTGEYLLDVGGYLSFIEKKEDVYLVNFIPENHIKELNQQNDLKNTPVLLNFTNESKDIASFLSNGRIYFIAAYLSDQENLKGRLWYLYQTSDGYILKRSKELQNRVFLYLAEGFVYKKDTNLAGDFYVWGNKLEDSHVAKFGEWIVDQVNLINIATDCPILSKDCFADCQNKNCHDDNGCGLPCGCADNEFCQRSGKCKSLPKNVCQLNNPCGDLNGKCFGNCPAGQICAVDANGNHYCKTINNSTVNSNLFMAIMMGFMFLIIILVFMVLWYRRRCTD